MAAPGSGRTPSSVRDLVLVAVLVVGSVAVAARVELFETFADWSREHEEYQFDEVVMGAVAGVVGLAYYSWRRKREADRQYRRSQNAEQVVAEMTGRFSSLFEHHPQAVVYLEPDGHLITANPATEKLLGYAPEELGSARFADFLPAEERDRAVDLLGRIADHEPRLFEVTMLHRDGYAVDASVTAVPIVIGDQVIGAFAIAEDVTGRNRLQRELAQARVRAEEASEAKTRFIANVSHELRTPLTSVLAAVELLDDTELDRHQARLVDSIDRAGHRLLVLVDDILEFTSLEAVTAGRAAGGAVDVRAVVAAALEACDSEARHRGLELVSRVDGGVPSLIGGDHDRLLRALSKLVGNAVKFTESGRIEVRVSRGEDAEGRPRVRFEVQDSGIGLTSDQQSRLFESFSQADTSMTRRYGGAGLGLVTCRHLVERMGGTLAVTSEPGVGSTFTVSLPLEQQPGTLW